LAQPASNASEFPNLQNQIPSIPASHPAPPASRQRLSAAGEGGSTDNNKYPQPQNTLKLKKTAENYENKTITKA
jgi:hypothetical protein